MEMSLPGEGRSGRTVLAASVPSPALQGGQTPLEVRGGGNTELASPSFPLRHPLRSAGPSTAGAVRPAAPRPANLQLECSEPFALGLNCFHIFLTALRVVPQRGSGSPSPRCCVSSDRVGWARSTVQGIMLVPMNSCLTEHPPKLPGPWAGASGVPLSSTVVIFAMLCFTHSSITILLSCHSSNTGQKRLWLSVVLREEQLSWPLLQLQIALKHNT